MYLPKAFHETDQSRAYAIIQRYGFASLVSVVDDAPFISHIPLQLEIPQDGSDDSQPNARLLGHFALANPHVEILRQHAQVLCIFQGPHAYVSPSWYTSGGVPTWNYALVHVSGSARLIEERSAKRAIVEQLTEQYERPREQPWVPDYSESMLDAIVGVEIEIDEINAKFKLSQNKSQADHDAVAEQFRTSPLLEEQALAKLMQPSES